ncbi:MAG: SulP family inorganic anion transporter [Rhodobacteraceae bacterium]|nr:SulP family inorganic anion transporter [Paracoccaceae bacterium]
MTPAIMARFARMAKPDLSLMNDEGFTASRLRIEILSGLTVALALVPEAVAFAFVAHVHPLVGLYAAFIVGLITALFGGRPGMISGATGALAVVMVALVIEHGVEYLFATVVLMGLLQIFAGVMQWGKFIRLVPHPVMLGFVNGLAIVIFLAQLTQFKVSDGDGQVWLSGTPLYVMLALVALTMAIIHYLPKLTKVIPAPLAGIGIVAAIVIVFGLDVPRVGDMASIEGGLPPFHIPAVPFTWETLQIILPYSIILAAIGLIESLLTLNLVGEMTGKRGGASQECVAQGLANTVTGFFGGMGGCAMIGQSMINVKSGGRTRIAGIAAALFLLFFILAGSSIIEQIPLAALVGVMFMVVIGTFAWNSFRIMRKVPLIDQGPLFFGSSDGFMELFTIDADPSKVIVDFADSRVVDQSALQAIEAVAAKYEAVGKQIQLRHLSRDCHSLLTKAGHLMVDSDDDPEYEIAANYSVRTGILEGGH